MTEPEAREHRRIRFDGSISAGHILTAIAMFAGLLTWGVRLEGRANDNDTRIARLETARERDEREGLVLRQVLAELTTSVRTLSSEVERLRTARERELERTRGGP
jgi:hypothetical protein